MKWHERHFHARTSGQPSLAQRGANLSKATGRATKAAACGNQVLVSADVRRQRQAACSGCPKEESDSLLGLKWCGVCGCMLAAKQRLATETCPLGRWPTAPTSE